MSAYAELKTAFKDRDCLVAALADVGYKDVELHDGEGVPLVGYHNDERPEKANVIVRRKHIGMSANDIGFVKRADGTFGAIISEFDSGKHNTKWMDGLRKNYTERVVAKEAKRQGLRLHSKTVVNGKTVVRYLAA